VWWLVGGRPSLNVLAFDAYGTLFDVMSVTAQCERHFPGQGEALASRWRAKQLQYSWLRSLMGRYADFWQITGEALDHAAASLRLRLDAACRQNLLDAYLSLDLFPDVRPGLDALRERGLRLAVLSNGAPAMLEAAARHANILDRFEVIVSADEVGIFKPSPAVYHRLLERLAVAPGEAGLVSSNSWDVAGATAAGLTALWLRRAPDEPADKLGVGPFGVINALDQAVDHAETGR
jgi:2-haloacid dehalogenase